MKKATKRDFLADFYDHVTEDMQDGDALVIRKGEGGKFTVVSMSGDAYVVTGTGGTIEEAWDNEL